MELSIHRGGMQTTVQDLGRRGYRADGVPLSGAMDPFALRVANSLVGNAEDAAALEFTLVGPELEVSGDALVALTGARCESVPNWRPFELKRGERVSLGPCAQGCRGYLAISGGIDVPMVLGSRGTYLRGGWGGFEGRSLRPGDRLQVGRSTLNPAGAKFIDNRWQIDPRMLPSYAVPASVRMVVNAPVTDFTEHLLTTAFTVSPQSDRMGLRLMANLPPTSKRSEAISSAVAPGTIQVPPDGQPVVLMADAQTIGGYPQAGHVINVDFPILAQLRPGDQLRFKEVDLAEAHRLAVARHRSVAILREGLIDKLGRVGTSHPA